MKTAEKVRGVGIVGFASAANGVLIAADRLEYFEAINAGGIIAFAAGPREGIGSGALGGYDIRSNTEGGRFYQMVRGDGIFQNVLVGEHARNLAASRNSTVHLAGVAAPFLGELGRKAAEVLSDDRRSPNSEVRLETRIIGAKLVDDVNGVKDPYYELRQEDGEIVRVRHFVEATGAQEHVNPMLEAFGEVFTSESVINGTSINPLKERVLDDRKELIIAGASHSGLSAAGNLLKAFSTEDGFDGKITILTRKPPKLYFPSPADAMMAGYEYDAGDLNHKNRVNEVGGLRGDAKDLAWSVLTGDEPRVEIKVVADLTSAISEGNDERVIVQALGYIPRVVPIYDVYGTRIGPLIDERGRVVTTENAQLIDYFGNPLPNASAIGHGHGIGLLDQLDHETSFQGSFENVYYFHGLYGEQVVYNLLNQK